MVTKIKLSNEFIEKMKEIEPNWGPLGWITFKRTYARWIEKEERNEEWFETLRRVVEGNINLDPRLKAKRIPKRVKEELQAEAEELFKIFYTLQACPPGRGLWVSGTDFAARTGDALNNCWFIAVRPQPYGDSNIIPFYVDNPNNAKVSMPFAFLFDQSMKGGGVGFNVSKENVGQIPKVWRKVNLRVTCDQEHRDFDKFKDKLSFNSKAERIKDVYFKIPDSREGWAESLALIIDAHFDQSFDYDHYWRITPLNVIIDVSDVRPAGERIKGFGGIASGPGPLIDLLVEVNDLLNERYDQKISSVDCTDIMNLIGRTVVAGNVRRTAEIALADSDDKDFITMKQDEEKLYSHRWASNNSIIIDTKFNDYDQIIQSFMFNGEPGIANLELARNYGRIIDGPGRKDPAVEGWNPCGEITLENGEPCNLIEIFPLIVDREGGDINRVIELAVRYAKRVTFSKYDWEVTRKVIEKNRRIGVSLSGIQDWVQDRFKSNAVIGWTNERPVWAKGIKGAGVFPVFNPELIKALNGMYEAVQIADVKYSDVLGCNYSKKTTTVKPSGTVALLPGVSPGVHFHYAGRMIRRIRFQENDPLASILKDCGYHVEPDVYSPYTVVIEFPVKAPTADNPAFKSAGDVTVEEQFAIQALFQTYWADNSVSCTITFNKEEAQRLKSLLRQYQTIIKSTSLLPYSGHNLKQAPYEPISKERYEEIVSLITGDPKEVANFDNGKDAEILDNLECEGGACPVR